MSRLPEAFPLATSDNRLRSRSEHKVSVEPDCSQTSSTKEDHGESEGSVQGTLVAAIATRDAVVAWFSANWIVLLYFSISQALLVLLIYLSFFAASMEDGSQPDFLSCRSWGFGTSCGLWGVDCRPFESDWSAFRCPTRCTLDQSSSLAVYGSSPYRADSRICRAAVHAGVVGSNGGCAFYRFGGAAYAFHSSTANEVTTKEFLSWFPKTIEFKKASSSHCSDLSWWILSVGFLSIGGLGLLPRVNASFMFYTLVAWGFFYVRLVGQPSSQDYAGISISSYGDVLILLAASSLAYRIAASSTFRGWESLSLKKRALMWILCYVVPYHVLINMNLIGYVPWLNIDLGGYEQLDANAGTYIVFTIIGVAVIFLAFALFRSLYRGGVWKKYVVLYVVVVTSVVISWALFPSTAFHLHHTMLGAFIIPITGFPTPPAAFAQATALGCFVQGYARWGWDSYLDTMPTYMTIHVPESAPNATNVTSSGATIIWEPLESVEAYSLRLNRVEVYRGLNTTAIISNLEPNITYFIGVAGVASWGTDGRVGPLSNFTTLSA